MPAPTIAKNPPTQSTMHHDDDDDHHHHHELEGLDMKAIRAAIPKECMEIDTFKSMAYYFQDMALIGALYVARVWLDSAFSGAAVGGGSAGWMIALVSRLVWWNMTGFMFWALFVVGHDCGHGVFSRSSTVNFVMGHICHAPILVPYTAWRNTHRLHHMYHNDLTRDKAWTPITEEHYNAWEADNVLGGVYRLMRFSPLMLFMFPYYLLAPGGNLTYGSHFNPLNSVIFPSTKAKLGGLISGLSVVGWLIFVWRVAAVAFPSAGFFSTLATVTDWYLIPYVIFTAWLSLVTYLHHTDTESRFFRSPEWSFAKGAETTIDRDYGALLNYLHHNIETHFVHHMFFTKLPHYHLKAATEAIKPLIKDHYKLDTRNPFVTFVKELTQVGIVPNEGANVGFILDHAKKTTKVNGGNKGSKKIQ